MFEKPSISILISILVMSATYLGSVLVAITGGYGETAYRSIRTVAQATQFLLQPKIKLNNKKSKTRLSFYLDKVWRGVLVQKDVMQMAYEAS